MCVCVDDDEVVVGVGVVICDAECGEALREVIERRRSVGLCKGVGGGGEVFKAERQRKR